MKRVTIRIDHDGHPSVEWVFPNVDPTTMQFDLQTHHTESSEQPLRIGDIEGVMIDPGKLDGATLDMHLDCRPTPSEICPAEVYSWRLVK